MSPNQLETWSFVTLISFSRPFLTFSSRPIWFDDQTWFQLIEFGQRHPIFLLYKLSFILQIIFKLKSLNFSILDEYHFKELLKMSTTWCKHVFKYRCEHIFNNGVNMSSNIIEKCFQTLFLPVFKQNKSTFNITLHGVNLCYSTTCIEHVFKLGKNMHLDTV